MKGKTQMLSYQQWAMNCIATGQLTRGHSMRGRYGSVATRWHLTRSRYAQYVTALGIADA
jgi:hypothetical protein